MNFLSQFDSMFENLTPMMSPLNSIMIGDVRTESGSDENGEWTKHSFTSEDGGLSITSFVRTNFNNKEIEPNKLSILKNKLETAVEKQDFEEAVKLRDEIKKLEKNKDKIESLKSELEKSIKEQNFEKSIELRDKLKNLE